MTTVLKLGGSVITRKDEPETVDDAALERAARAVAGVDPGELVVVHGGGSFGHPHADRHGVSTAAGTRDAGAARAVHDAMGRLNRRVLDAFHDAGARALPVHPLSAGARDREGELALPTGAVATMLGEELLPVLHGDVVAHAGSGVTVVSGDELVVSLARAFDADRVGLCTGVPGVLDEAGAVIEEIESFDAVAPALGDAGATDVTGGIAGKVRALLELPAPAHVFGLDGLEAFLSGGHPGTVVRGG